MSREQNKTCKICGTTDVMKGRRYCGACYSNHWKEYNKKWHRANTERKLLNHAQSRAKEHELPFNLELEDIIIPKYCPILGLKLERGIGKVIAESPSIDKINPTLGYVKGNIRVISFRANTLKNNATLDELKKIVQDAEYLASSI